MHFIFFFNTVLLGIGLAMDAFSVSLANGLHEPCMTRKKLILIAVVFGFFQALMPLLGWILVHTVLEYFSQIEVFIPWIALILLLYIGIKMLIESCNKDEDDKRCLNTLTISALIIQGIATSIDALSVGLTIAEQTFSVALTSAIIIGVVTFLICTAGLIIGKNFGTKFSHNAEKLGGIILIAIGIEIFLTGIF
ncbi:MAG: manganese efflux pump [Clostridia bacterium]|nr:manganese efflux pump [Clostridia bacterium]